MRKTIKGLVMAFVLTLACAGFAFADSTAALISGSNVAAKGGDTGVEVTFSIENNSGIASLGAVLDYDADKLTLTDLQAGEALSAGNPVVNVDAKKFGWFNTENVTSNGTLFKAKFDVSDDASGSYDIVIKSLELTDENDTDVAFQLVSGRINISTAYAVTFDAGGAAGEVPTMDAQEEGAYLVLPAPDGLTAPEGKVFAGWTASTNGQTYEANNTKPRFQYQMTAEAVTFTAKWVDYFKVTVRAGNGDVVAEKSYGPEAFAGLASDSDDPQTRMYFKGDVWNVATAATYVTLDDLLADATGSDAYALAGLAGDASIKYGTEGFNYTFTAAELRAESNFYPAATPTGTDAAGAVTVTPCFSLTGNTAVVTTTAGDAQASAAAGADGETAPRFICGITEEELLGTSAAGQPSVTGCTFLTVTLPAPAHSVLYSTHVQYIGWQDEVGDGAMAGTEGHGWRLEGIKLALGGEPAELGGSIQYSTHIQYRGWEEPYKSDGEMSGTEGLGLRLEAIKIKLDGNVSEAYDVYYRVHAQNIGWMGWAKNDEPAGTEGYGWRLEGIQVKLVKKGEPAPGDVDGVTSVVKYSFTSKQDGPSDPLRDDKLVSYNTHVQYVGWKQYVADGQMAGTVGRGLNLEGIHINLGGAAAELDGSIKYETHVQNIGWQGEVSDGQMAGTEGQGLRLEAIKIKLTDEVEAAYDVYYRVHAQYIGWMGWAKNGEEAGTAGYGWRLEGIQIMLLPKGEAVPDVVDGIESDYPDKAFVKK